MGLKIVWGVIVMILCQLGYEGNFKVGVEVFVGVVDLGVGVNIGLF